MRTQIAVDEWVDPERDMDALEHAGDYAYECQQEEQAADDCYGCGKPFEDGDAATRCDCTPLTEDDRLDPAIGRSFCCEECHEMTHEDHDRANDPALTGMEDEDADIDW